MQEDHKEELGKMLNEYNKEIDALEQTTNDKLYSQVIFLLINNAKMIQYKKKSIGKI